MITQKKIAEALGISTSTVANILNGTPHYKKETVERVRKAVEEFGYQPNRASRAIKRGRSNLIGVVHTGSAFEVGQKAVYALLQEISKSDYSYLVVDLHWHKGDARRVLNEMVQARVEGVILCADTSAVFTKEVLAVLKRAGIPVVSLYGDNQLGLPVVGDSAALSFYALTRHLQGVGHRSLLFFSCPRDEFYRSTEGRIHGFRSAVRGWGEFLEYDEALFTQQWPRLCREYREREVGIIVYLDHARMFRSVMDASALLSRHLFASGAVPDAILATNDRAAYGVMSEAHEAGLRVPGGLAVTGADDDELSRLPLFRLTSVRQDVERSSTAVVAMLLARIRGEKTGEQDQYYPSQLVLRQSCGRMVGAGEPLELCISTAPLAPELESAG